MVLASHGGEPEGTDKSRGEGDGPDEEGCNRQVRWGLCTGSGGSEQERVVYTDNGQEEVGGDYRQAVTGRWSGGGTGGGR